MTTLRFLGLAALVALPACGRALLQRSQDLSERINASIPASQFRTIAAIAVTDSRTGLQVSHTVRSQLTDSGFSVIRRSGRWDSEVAALQAACAPEADPVVQGVLFISYNQLELRDCTTGTTAYLVTNGEDGSVGITEMTNRLARYLRPPTPVNADSKAGAPESM
jgi:hypothetical protein